MTTDEKNRQRAYSQISVALETRKSGPKVWVFRYSQKINGSKQRRKVVLGTAAALTRSQAHHASEQLLRSGNVRLEEQRLMRPRQIAGTQ